MGLSCCLIGQPVGVVDAEEDKKNTCLRERVDGLRVPGAPLRNGDEMSQAPRCRRLVRRHSCACRRGAPLRQLHQQHLPHNERGERRIECATGRALSECALVRTPASVLVGKQIARCGWWMNGGRQIPHACVPRGHPHAPWGITWTKGTEPTVSVVPTSQHHNGSGELHPLRRLRR